MRLINDLDIPWLTLGSGSGKAEVAIRLDKLTAFSVESLGDSLTVTLCMAGSTTGLAIPMSPDEYDIFIKALILFEQKVD